MKPTKLAAALLAGILLLAAAPASVSAREAGQEGGPTEQARGRGPLEKSLLIPGWGQLAEKRWLEGALFLGAEAFCLVEALRQNRLGNSAYVAYKAAASREDAARWREETERRDTRRNRLLLAGAAVWALNLLDIHLIVRGKEGAAKTLSLRLGHDQTQALVAVAGLRF
jgi:hypothetical protein